jgi:UPF0176 protein
MQYQVLLFYKYVHIDDTEAFKKFYTELCTRHGLLGRTIIAEEGLNGTLEGTLDNTEAFVKELLEDKRFCDMQIKRSEGTGATFPRLSVKIRNEIVGTHFPKEVDPTKKTGKYLKPDELREWYESGKDFVVVDMRNSYEFESGHFKNSFDPKMDASRELPEKIEAIKEAVKDKPVLTVCTGGVRCEKMSAYLLHEGFDEDKVYQLDGGMHSYMEKYPGKDFLGTLFTFDNRLVMDFGGEREVIGKCKRCGATNEQYQNCANADCNMLFLICDDCMSAEGPGFCSEKCEKSTARVVNRVRGRVV